MQSSSGTAVVNQWLTTVADGKRYRVSYYNLAVGHRIHSARGTRFRRWTDEQLREYLVKGFALNDEQRIDQAVALWEDYKGRKASTRQGK